MKLPMPTGEEKGNEPQDYEVKEAFDTLTKAEAIKKNGKLMKHVHKHAKAQMGHIKSIADLRKKHAEMVGMPKGGDESESTSEAASETATDEMKEKKAK